MACCDVCGEVFTLKFNLNVHIKNKHSEVGQGSLINCNECEYVAVNSNMNQHNNNCSQFTKKFPIYFPSSNITRKMHLTSDFVLPKMIKEDKTANICYKFLKVEQAGERLHQIWNLLNRTRFFSVRNGKSQLLYAFMEYENLL